MKAISLWQPWASLWLSPRKIHETRHWSIQVPLDGFWLAVHAAKRPMTRLEIDEFAEMLANTFGEDWQKTLPRGAVIGRVFVTACLSTNGPDVPPLVTDDYWCGDFSAGRFMWRRTKYEVLPTPVPWRGLQGLFSVPDTLFRTAPK